MSTSNSRVKNEELLLLVASSGALSAAGLDMGLIEAMPGLPSSDDAPNASTGSPLKITIGRLKTAKFESVDEVRLQLGHLSCSGLIKTDSPIGC